MTIEFKFSFGQFVRLLPLDSHKGRVVSVYNNGNGPEYDIRFFMNGSDKVVRFFEDELEAAP